VDSGNIILKILTSDCEAVTFTGFLADKRSVAVKEPTTTPSTNSSSAASDNCLMFKCSGGSESCSVTDELAASDGVLSVQIVNRHPAVVSSTTAEAEPTSTTTTATTEEDDNRTLKNSTPASSHSLGGILPIGRVHDEEAGLATTEETPSVRGIIISSTVTTRSSDESFPLRPELAPVWAVSLAVVVAIVCVGMNIALLGAYLCYRRQRTRAMRGSDGINRGVGGIKAPTLHAFNPTPPHIQHPHRLSA